MALDTTIFVQTAEFAAALIILKNYRCFWRPLQTHVPQKFSQLGIQHVWLSCHAITTAVHK